MQANTKREEVDAFTQYVMGKIDPDVFKTLNLVQLEAIRSAVSANAPFKKHPLDIRVSVPLYFTKLYIVFLVGKDKRSSTRAVLQQRRNMAKSAGFFFFVYAALMAIAPIVFLFLYALKSALGIDLFPDTHLFDFL